MIKQKKLFKLSKIIQKAIRFSIEALISIINEKNEIEVTEKEAVLECLLSMIEFQPVVIKRALIKWKLIDGYNLIPFIQSLNLTNPSIRFVATEVIKLHLNDPSVIEIMVYILQKHPYDLFFFLLLFLFIVSL